MFRRKKNDFDDDDYWYDLDEDDTSRRSSSRRLGLFVALTTLLIVMAALAAFWMRASRQVESLSPPTAVPVAVSPTPAALAMATVSPSTTHSAKPSPAPSELTVVTAVSPPIIQPESPATYNPDALAQQMLILINQSRADNNLSPVAWDTTATLAGQRHAEDMAQFNYFSHWNRDGLGPDHRYSLIGGQHVAMENLHAFAYTYDDGRAAPIENWPEVIQNAHTGLMNSPGHRANILDSAHTHVGIGMAYNPQTGQFRLAQEFTNQYTRLDEPLARQVGPDGSILVRGQFVGADLSNALLQLAYEPFPQPLSLDELAQTNTYTSVATDVETRRVALTFDELIPLRQASPGYYHIRLFVDTQGQQALVLNHVLEVR